MKLDKDTLIVNGIFFLLIIVIALLRSGAPFAGLISLFIGAINIVLGIIFSITKKEMKARTTLLIGGLLILIGYGLCSISPLIISH